MAAIVIVLFTDLSQIFAERYRRPHRLLIVVFLQNKLSSTVTAYVHPRLVKIDVDFRMTEWTATITGHDSLCTDDDGVFTNQVDSKARVHKFLLINKSDFSVVVRLKYLSSMGNLLFVLPSRSLSVTGPY